MHARLGPLVGITLAAAALSACDVTRSSTPTSPLIAGPIAGVEITPPRPLLPLANATVVADGSAVVLLVENASTNGVRTLSYTFELSADAGFAEVAFAATGIAPGAEGRTSVTVTSGLVPGRNFHWRARALDGANTGPYSEVRQFSFQEPIVINAPVPLEPMGGVRVATRQPTLRTRNADVTGPAGALTYDFQVALNDAFDNAIQLTVGEQPSTTQATVSVPLELERTYVWRVRARGATVTGAWSTAHAFLTPLVVVAPPPPPGPGPGPTPPPPEGSGFPSTSEGTAMVEFVLADLRARGISVLGDCGAFEVTKRVAWHFRNRGAGLEYKPGGRRCEDRSIDIVLFNDGRSVDILIGGGVDNGPAWQVEHPYEGWQNYWRAPYNPDGEEEVAHLEIWESENGNLLISNLESANWNRHQQSSRIGPVAHRRSHRSRRSRR
jgi:hypothetical protein